VPFFDLEFVVLDEEDNAEGGDNKTQNREQEGATCENESDEEEEDREEEREFNFMLSSGSSNDRADLICLCLLPMSCSSRKGSCRLSPPHSFSTL
jgi:hypothetical protein